jgi:N-methylhydantoinase A
MFGAARMGMIRLGIDIGGTFTDFALRDPARGRSAVHKRLTTPGDPAEAVLAGVAAIAAEHGIVPADIGEIVHGTTLVTNALIERRGARVGMLVTEGFRDTFDVGQEQRYDLYDLRLRFAEPLVPRALRAEVRERLRHDGSVLLPLDEAAATAELDRLVVQERIEALAICLLHSYADDRHERRLADIARRRYPALAVSTSSEVFPYPREFERWTTACANAYAQPLVDGYLDRLERGLAGLGFSGHLAIIGSGGGLLTPAQARRFPVRLLESGPAAGVLMAARIGDDLGLPDLLAFDLGGTTAKGALVRKGRPSRRYVFEAAHAHEHRSGSGLQLRIPVLDMVEIGAGGGSVVALDTLGRLRVGPRSAGAVPGPACYDRGGTEPTLTDANLALGYLDPMRFLGGAMPLDPGRAAAELARLGASGGVDPARLAWGIHDIANEDIARAFRMHATERGVDLRRAAMVASGGGGPLHGARIARKLCLPEVVFPADAGVMSAFGMLTGAPAFEVIRVIRQRLDALDGPALAALLAPAEAEVAGQLAAAGIAPETIRIERRLDMRYAGQGDDLELPLPPGPVEPAVAELAALFAAAYAAEYGAPLDQPVEVITAKIEAIGPAPDPARVAQDPAEPGDPADADSRAAVARRGSRRAFFPRAGGMIDCPVYDRYALPAGSRLVGPCLVEERESTVLLDHGDTGRVCAAGHLRARIAPD